MTCREFAQFIIDYTTGEMDTAVRDEFRHHLEICVNCQRYLASYEASVTLGRHAFDDDTPLPADVPEELVNAILSTLHKPS